MGMKGNCTCTYGLVPIGSAALGSLFVCDLQFFYPNLTQLHLSVFHMYPHALLEIYPMVHNLLGLDWS
jgi:hypothetical protein